MVVVPDIYDILVKHVVYGTTTTTMILGTVPGIMVVVPGIMVVVSGGGNWGWCGWAGRLSFSVF